VNADRRIFLFRYLLSSSSSPAAAAEAVVWHATLHRLQSTASNITTVNNTTCQLHVRKPTDRRTDGQTDTQTVGMTTADSDNHIAPCGLVNRFSQTEAITQN